MTKTHPIGFVLALVVSACCHPTATTPATPPPEDAHPMPDPEAWRATPPNPACGPAFAALLALDLAGWPGIAGCTRRDAEDALGPSEAFSGTFGPGRRHIPAATGPMGIHVQYAADDSIFAVAFQAKVTAEHLTPLGAPDDERTSGLGPELRQLAWATRGLIVHRSMFEQDPSLVIGFVPMPLETLRTAQVFNLAMRETLAP